MRLIDADNLRGRMVNGNDKITIDCAPTIDPIKAAGGCYCRECCFGRKPRSEYMGYGYVYCEQQHEYRELDAFCSGGEPGEAQGDG